MFVAELRTGFRVPPCEVRLSPSKKAPYWWKILRPGAEQVFLKPLSRCNRSDYQSIIDHLGDGFEACPKISSPSSTEHITPGNGEKYEDERQDETTAHNNGVTPTEEAWYAESIRKFEQDIVIYQSRIEELEEKVSQADEQILRQGARIFQFDLMINRIGEVLQEHQQNNQTYDFVQYD